MSGTVYEGLSDRVKAKPKMATDIPASITTPDSVETRLGTLNFFDGFPDDATVQTVYENLDFQRGVQAFLTALPAASLVALRTGIRTFGPDNQTVLITESLLDSRSLSSWRTPRPSTTSPGSTRWMAHWWSRCRRTCSASSTISGAVTSPTWAESAPIRARAESTCCSPRTTRAPCPTATSSCAPAPTGTLCSFVASPWAATRQAVENTKQHFRVYPLDRAANPPTMTFVNISGTVLQHHLCQRRLIF